MVKHLENTAIHVCLQRREQCQWVGLLIKTAANVSQLIFAMKTERYELYLKDLKTVLCRNSMC